MQKSKRRQLDGMNDLHCNLHVVETYAIQLGRSSSLLVQDLEKKIHPISIRKSTIADLMDSEERDVSVIRKRRRGSLQGMVAEDLRVHELGDIFVSRGKRGFGKRGS